MEGGRKGERTGGGMDRWIEREREKDAKDGREGENKRLR